MSSGFPTSRYPPPCQAIGPTTASQLRWKSALARRRVAALPLVTMPDIGCTLGVRRNTVSVEAHSLQQAGLIRYSRGQITVLDRDGLEDCACECYSVIRTETGKLMGPA